MSNQEEEYYRAIEEIRKRDFPHLSPDWYSSSPEEIERGRDRNRDRPDRGLLDPTLNDLFPTFLESLFLNEEKITLQDIFKEKKYGGPLMSDEQEIMDELLASYGGNEMRAYTPGPFEKQEQAIESFLSGIGQFAGEKEIPFLKALADPAYARNVAGNLSFGTEMTPGVGDVQAIREGAFMMGEDQPLMGSAFIAGSLFTGMSSSQLKKALEKLKKELNEKIPALRARSQSNWRSYDETGNKGDRFDAERLERQADRSETRINREIGEVEDRLKQQELPLGWKKETAEKMRQGKTSEFIGTADEFGLAKTGRPRTQWDKLNEEQLEAVDILQDALLKTNPNISPVTARLYAKEKIKNLRYHQSNAYYDWLKKHGFSGKDQAGIPVATGINQRITDVVNKAAKLDAEKEILLGLGRARRSGTGGFKTTHEAATETPEPKGIINATPEIRKLYDDLQRGWKKDLTPEHRQLSKEMSEQTAEFNKFLDEADLDERNQLVQMLLDMKNKKPK